MRYFAFLTFIGLVLGAIILWQLARYSPGLGDPIGGDFLNYWVAPQLARENIAQLFSFPDYLHRLQLLAPSPGIYEHNWSYPLHALFFFAPFSWLPYYVALSAWTLLGTGAYLYAVKRNLPRPTGARFYLLLVLSPAAMVNIVTGQNGLWLAALALFAWPLLKRRPVLAGILIGCLSIKPQLGLLWPVLLLATGARKTFLTALLTVLLLIGASLLLHGVPAWHEYLAQVPAMQWALVTQAPDWQAEAIPIMHLMMVSPLASLRLLGVQLGLAVFLQVILSFGVIVLGFFALRRAAPSAALLIFASGSLLVTPYGFNYDLALLSAALAIRWAEWPPTSPRDRWLEGAAFLLPWLVYKFNGLPLPLAPLILAGIFFTASIAALCPNRPSARSCSIT